MLKRIGSVSSLACVLILLAASPVLSHAADESRGTRPVGTSVGAVPIDPTTAGAGATGDDDTPFIDGQTTAPGTVKQPTGKSRWSAILEAHDVQRSAYLAKRWWMNLQEWLR
jgi:hypothetical protein